MHTVTCLSARNMDNSKFSFLIDASHFGVLFDVILASIATSNGPF